MSMSEKICRVGSEIVHQSRCKDTSSITAQVRLRYRFPNHGESVILARVEVAEGTEDRWRRTRRRIEASAWDWLEQYFDGTCFDSDQANIFCDDVFDESIDGAKKRSAELSAEKKKDLQRELRQIELDFAGLLTTGHRVIA